MFRVFSRNNSNSIRHYTSALRLTGFDAPTVWQEFSPLAVQHSSFNLGQGFPDWDTPDFVKEELVRAAGGSAHQYCRSMGDLLLTSAISKHYQSVMNRVLNPATEITVSAGATGALFSVMQSYLNPGDEVVVFEPSFDIYRYPAQVQMAGGVCKYVPLQLDEASGRWSVDMQRLEEAITPRTKILLINTPHNPTGKVFNKQELSDIATVVRRHEQLMVVTDEVYEWLLFDGLQHTRFCTLPDMWDRTISVSSSGKTLSATGWKIGWAYGPERLIKPLASSNQWIQYCVNTPTQIAVARSLDKASQPYEGHDSYYSYISTMFQKKRDFLTKALSEANFRPLKADAGYFVMADPSAHHFPKSFVERPGLDGVSPVSKDWGFSRWLTEEIGVTPIPVSAFYANSRRQHAKYLDKYLEDAAAKLAKLK